jgi:hypothetical protein
MRRTYQDARHILVLNSRLQFYRRNEICVIEGLSRLFLSGWTSRLWTLQEACLARTVWIQFKDQAVDLDAMMVDLSQLASGDLAFLPFAFDLIQQYRSLRPKFPSALSNETIPSNRYQRFFSSLMWLCNTVPLPSPRTKRYASGPFWICRPMKS